MDRKIKPAWRRLGREIRTLRIRSGMTQAQVAKEMQMVPSHISAWECGTRGMTGKQAEKLDRALNTSGVIARAWAKAHAPDPLPVWYEEVEQLERRVTELREYQPQLIPGLIQIEDYARAVYREGAPWITPTDRERRVRSRLQRQHILEKEAPPLVSMVVEASVIQRAIGGQKVLKEQLTHVLGLIEREAIRFQVMAPDAECHPGASGPFRIYTFVDTPQVASAEYMGGEMTLDDTMKIQQCATIFGVLQSEALSPRASSELVRKVRDNLDVRA
ncbi:helix-turn-helix domain-containing protein [Marinitenerispora sediminis]|uniref:Transcriptional regulator n=1 Tax=Marinitenerispora sediminis TaxID=1931232 RepID=A0A368TCD5_9ACTN|nr:helix-turn-helix transcriptional regulator [Marinitenerispora sediminis]RCV56666.1 transcriptional regulator [Marinitenerispora sediminis]RCV61658.1 transcriptional regulator [Marinitenerispora sediminis]RCV62610.1 transcriptional regulator [Marinitenerispora sediminis]